MIIKITKGKIFDKKSEKKYSISECHYKQMQNALIKVLQQNY